MADGAARYWKAVTAYPTGHSYNPGTRTLRVGDGEFSPVAPEVWNYAVSGMQVVKSWLDRRKLDPVGRKSSPLDEIGPERWDFGEELLALLWILESTIALQPEGEALLDEICAGPLFTAAELPSPSAAERRPPDAYAGMTAIGGAGVTVNGCERRPTNACEAPQETGLRPSPYCPRVHVIPAKAGTYPISARAEPSPSFPRRRE